MKSWYETGRKAKLKEALSEHYASGRWEQLEKFTKALYNLENVPVEYLVYDPKLLPMEAVRFFYIDENWIECLIDGALSIGRNTSFALEHDRVMRKSMLCSFRTHIKNGENVRTGFLIRSKLISGWPGINIQCYTETGRDRQPLTCCHMRRIQSDILFYVADGRIDAVELTEPTEGIGFGFTLDAEGEITLPFFPLPPVETVKTAVDFERKNSSDFLKVPFRQGADGVVDIEKLANQINQKIDVENDGISALEFSAELMKTPVKYSIKGELL